MSVEGESTVAEGGGEVDRAGTPEERREVVGEASPDVLDTPAGRSQMHEHEPAVRPEHAMHLPERSSHAGVGKHVDEVAGEYRVEGVVGKGKCGCAAVAEAVPVVSTVRHPASGPAQHGGRDVHTLRPTIWIGTDKWGKCEAGAGTYLENSFTVLHPEPVSPDCSGGVGDAGDETVVEGRETCIRHPLRICRSKCGG